MKILHIAWGLQVGGLESMLIDILNTQAIEHDISLIIINDEVDQRLLAAIDVKVQVFLVRRPRQGINPYYWFRFLYYVVKIRPDIFHVHQDAILSLLRFFKQSKVVTFHDTGINPTQALRFADQVFCISQAVLADISEKLPNVRLKVVENGIPVDKFWVRTEYANNDFNIVQVGRLDHIKKGQDILLYALAELIRLNLGVDIKLDFIGDGPSKNELQNLAESLHVKEQCRFIGTLPREYIYQHLRDYDLLVQPSRFEGFGLTVAEAMAAKIPVLVADIEGPMEIIAQGEYGYFFKVDDASACANEIAKIIKVRTESAFLNAMEAARQRVFNQYDVSNTAKLYLIEYKKLLNAS